MKNIPGIIQKGALLYCLVCILQALVLPNFLEGKIDNYLFPVGLINLGMIFIQHKKWRVPIGLFVLLFSWSFIVEIWQKGQPGLSNLPYLLYFIKWPVIIFTLFNEWKQNKINAYIPSIMDGLLLTLLGLNLFMVLNPLGLGEALQNLYAPKSYTNFIYYHDPGAYRLTGTQMNPNDNAVIFCLFFVYYLIFRIECWYYLGLCVGIILLTQSRTLFIVIALIIMIQAIRKMGKIKSKTKLIVFFSLGAIFLTAIVLASRNLRSLFTGGAFESHSLKVRLDNFTNSMDEGLSSAFTGKGVIEDALLQFGVHIDSEIVALILQYGWIGLLLWVAILIGILYSLKDLGDDRRVYVFYIILIIVGVSLTNFCFLHGALGVVFSVFLGISSLNLKRNEELPQ